MSRPAENMRGRAGNGGDGHTRYSAHEAQPGFGDTGTSTPLHAEAASVGRLLRQLTEDVPELIIKELALARAEISESMAATRAGIASLVGGGAVLLSGLLVLLMSAVYGLSNVVAPWLAALIVGGVVLLIGLAMVAAGKKKLEPSNFRPDRTMHQMHKDKDAMKGRAT